NTAKTPILEAGGKVEPLSPSNEAGQYDETQAREIGSSCRWFGVDGIFVFDYSRATWNNSEAQTRNFLQCSLNPWLRRIECEISRKLIRPSQRKELYAEYVREAVIQMDAKTQHEIWKIGV